MESALTVKNMSVDVNAKLNDSVRKNLSEIIENEFKSRVQIDYVKKNEEKRKIIERHRKSLKIENILSDIRRKEDDIKELRLKLERNGFNSRGEYSNGCNKDIEEELGELNKSSQEILTIKHKLITRLQLSTTVGEATVIMHDILGNTLIPEISSKALTFQNKNQ